MKKPFSLDYSIESEQDRLKAINNILDTLDQTPPPSDLELMAFYILCGKDSNGQNAIQRGEITTGHTRYNSFRRTDDKNVSLDALIENPLTDQNTLKDATEKRVYVIPHPTIHRPKYDKKTGELLDIGDANVPGMQELWQSIDGLERWIAQLEGKIPPDEDTLLFNDSYRLYKLKHQLIDLRRHQYYLRDSYKPVVYFPGADHPRPQYIDWSSDSYYWITMEEWRKRTSNALTHIISKKIEDYETREGLVKWVVREHTFNWEDPKHINAFIINYDRFYNTMHNKINTYGKTLLMDFERYRTLANLSEMREYALQLRLIHYPVGIIVQAILTRFGVKYTENHLAQILYKEIPKKIALAATKVRLQADTPKEQKKQCFHCKQFFPRDKIFFSLNGSRKDGLASNCKDCEKKMRIARGQNKYDKRSKEADVPKMQARKAGN